MTLFIRAIWLLVLARTLQSLFSAYEMHALLLLLSCAAVSAAVTVYGPQGVLSFGEPSGSGSTASATLAVNPATYTNTPAFNSIVLTPPPIPVPPPPTQFSLTLANSANNVPGISIMQSGDFLGFSIEMSVANEICELLFYKSCACIELSCVQLA